MARSLRIIWGLPLLLLFVVLWGWRRGGPDIVSDLVVGDPVPSGSSGVALDELSTEPERFEARPALRQETLENHAPIETSRQLESMSFESRLDAESPPVSSPTVSLRISGRVVTERNEGLAAVRVSANLEKRAHAISFGASNQKSFKTKTDVDGYFELEVASEGLYTIDAKPWDLISSRTLQRVTSGTDDLSIVLPDLGGVFIRFVDGVTKQPVEASSVFRPDSYGVTEDRVWWKPVGEDRYKKLRVSKNDIGELIEVEVLLGVADFYFEFRQHAPFVVQGVGIFGRPDPVLEVPLQKGCAVTLHFQGEEDTRFDGNVFLHPERGVPWYGAARQPGKRQLSVAEGVARGVGFRPGMYYLGSIGGYVFEPDSIHVTAADTAIPVHWRLKE